MIRWFYISLPHATFAIVSTGEKITNAAPIAKWMIGKTLQEIKPWLLKHVALIVKELK